MIQACGKTRFADALLKNDFQGRGMTVQFHPAVTYETFVSGISPDVSAAGLRFGVKPGWLLNAVQAARETDGDYLLVIDNQPCRPGEGPRRGHLPA